MRLETKSYPTSSSKSVPSDRRGGRWRADAFFDGRLTVLQSAKGYRFSIDAVLVAWYGRPRPGERVLDLGTGCGIISLIMALRAPSAVIWGIDNQPAMAAVAALNAARNGLSDRVRVRCRDLRTLSPSDFGGGFDRVVSNPPFRKAASGRLNPNVERARARHEITANHVDVVSAASRMLKPGGRFITIYPAERLVDVIVAMRSSGLEPKWLAGVRSKSGEAAKLAVLEGVKGGRPSMRMAPSLCIYREDGGYTEAADRMFRL